ncbi:MAG TPA: respiratory nitrate reductase subunit gamma [Anaeromyxobacteraceae bacterium]|nr:respiratory nitrate reductase subunit gamma [Anaeromyxobacteraceae bacterium]
MIVHHLAFAVFLVGTAARIARWLKAPVPFHLTLFPTPPNTIGKVRAMATELFLARTLFREDRLLWLWSGLLHVSLALVLAGHVLGITFLRGQFTLVGLSLQASHALSSTLGEAAGAAMAIALAGLFFRRVALPKIRRLSGPASFFDLFLLLAIALSGLSMSVPRFAVRLPEVRTYMGALLTFRSAPLPHSPAFVIHLFLVDLLLFYFPFSRLLHSAGFFFGHAMLLESPPTYPTPASAAPRSAFAAKES